MTDRLTRLQRLFVEYDAAWSEFKEARQEAGSTEGVPKGISDRVLEANVAMFPALTIATVRALVDASAGAKEFVYGDVGPAGTGKRAMGKMLDALGYLMEEE